MIDLKTVTIGTDAELPIQLLTGEFFPVTGLIGGTKDDPRPLPKLGKGFAVQEDNVNAEFNIPPAKDKTTFYKSIHNTIKAVEELLPPTMRLHHASSMKYAEALIRNGACRSFGCQPDYNAYTEKENPMPVPGDPTFRTAAAHVHVGWKDPNRVDRIKLVKLLDLTLGLTAIPYDDFERKKLYGQAGAFRPKEYGVEYRTLGNFWIYDYCTYIFSGVIKAINMLNNDVVLTPEQEQEVIKAVNTGKPNNTTDLLIGRYNLNLFNEV